MSTPEQVPFATPRVSHTTDVSTLAGHTVARLVELAHLNLDISRSTFAGAALHWEAVWQAQTPEQFVTRQAEMLPWLAVQIAGYTRAWMDVASKANTGWGNLIRDHSGGPAQPVRAAFSGMAVCAKGIDAMMRTVNPLHILAGVDDATANGDQFATQGKGIARAAIGQAADLAPGRATRRRTPSARRQSSR